jgi:hypothetical protein
MSARAFAENDERQMLLDNYARHQAAVAAMRDELVALKKAAQAAINKGYCLRVVATGEEKASSAACLAQCAWSCRAAPQTGIVAVAADPVLTDLSTLSRDRIAEAEHELEVVRKSQAVVMAERRSHMDRIQARRFASSCCGCRARV